ELASRRARIETNAVRGVGEEKLRGVGRAFLDHGDRAVLRIDPFAIGNVEARLADLAATRVEYRARAVPAAPQRLRIVGYAGGERRIGRRDAPDERSVLERDRLWIRMQRRQAKGDVPGHRDSLDDLRACRSGALLPLGDTPPRIDPRYRGSSRR